jgi:hypothetical protein
MNTSNIKIFESVITPAYQDFIKAQLFATTVPWTFLPDVTAHADKGNLGFSHTAFEFGAIKSTCYWFLYPILLECCAKQGIEILSLERIRVGLYVNVNSDRPHTKHVDMQQPHLVGLYYVDDADGDTVFYADGEGGEEILRCKPKKGTMVIFDGSVYHASTSPIKTSHRVTVNYIFFTATNNLT